MQETKKRARQDNWINRSVRQNGLQRKCACGGQPTVAGGECPACRAKREKRETAVAGVLQRNRCATASTYAAPPVVHEVLGSPGQPLDGATRAFMEPRFGHDFSGVRVHTGEKAAQSARAVNAHAYTVGNRVAFGEGRYAPGSTDGRRLLAHELVHVVQQKNNPQLQTQLEVGSPDTAAEREAERAAEAIVHSSPFEKVPVSAARSASSLQRGLADGRPGATDACDKLNFRTCSGQACNGRRGQCTWYGPKIGCRCRDTSEGKPHPVRFEVPDWLATLVGAAVVAAIVACFATGVCEVGAVVAGLGAAAAAAVIALLNAAGVVDSGRLASNTSSGGGESEKNGAAAA